MNNNEIAELRAEVKALRERIEAIEAFPAGLLKAFEEQLATPSAASPDAPAPRGPVRILRDPTAGGVAEERAAGTF